jgi:hypothetical protein
MTHEPDHPDRDPALDSAWREHSAEMPSAATDAAILAAAHRAVKSAPRDVAKPAAEATSPQRWWMPLAAAATIGAVALGVLQTMPQQEIVTAPAVNHTPARAPEHANALPSAPRDEPATVSRKDAPRAAAESVAPPAPPASAPPAARPAVPPAKPEARAAAPQPFPAEKKAASAESDVKDRSSMAPTLATVPEAAPPPPAAPAAAAPMPEFARTDARQRNEAMQSAPAAAGAMALGKTATRMDAPAVSAADIDAWIVRIRKLHDEGKLADAAKELTALRAAIPDADSRLPRELRAWAATVKP